MREFCINTEGDVLQRMIIDGKGERILISDGCLKSRYVVQHSVALELVESQLKAKWNFARI